jgi:hypothetical protein
LALAVSRKSWDAFDLTVDPVIGGILIDSTPSRLGGGFPQPSSGHHPATPKTLAAMESLPAFASTRCSLISAFARRPIDSRAAG